MIPAFLWPWSSRLCRERRPRSAFRWLLGVGLWRTHVRRCARSSSHCMADAAAHRKHVDAARYQRRGVAVAQGVEAHPRQIARLHEPPPIAASDCRAELDRRRRW